MPEYVSSLDASSGVLGRTSLPPTVVDQQPQQQFQPQATAPRIDLEALTNSAIEGRQRFQAQHQNIANQRTQLAAKLASAPAGRRGQGIRAALGAQLQGLNVQEHNLGREEAFQDWTTRMQTTTAFRNAQAAHNFAKEDLAQQTAQQAGEVFLRGTEIMGKYKPGTQEFHDAMADLKDKYPLGFASESIKGHFGQIAKFHDQEMDRNLKTLQNTLFKQTGLSSQDFAGIDNVRGTNAPVLKKDAQGNTVMPTLEEIEQGRKDTGTSGEKAANIAFDVNGQTHIMNKGLFNTLSKTFRQQPTQAAIAVASPNADADAQAQGYRNAAQLAAFKAGQPLVQPTGQTVAQPQATPVNTDPRIPLAQKALNDPNASEAHKAAARQILGLSQ